MLVFLSWSGERSHRMAVQLQKWLKKVLQATDPWMSPDIEKGSRWGSELAAKLESTRYGILCLTPENLESKWLLYEAGAIAKQKESRACTVLLGLTPAEIEPPLSDFQATKTDYHDFLRLAMELNRHLETTGGAALDEATLQDVFDTFWPELESAFAELESNVPSTESVAGPTRTEGDMLEELLSYARQTSAQRAGLHDGFLAMGRPEVEHLVQLASGKPYDPIGLAILSSILPPSFSWLGQLSCDLYRNLERGALVDPEGELKRLKYLLDTSIRFLWSDPERAAALRYFSDYILYIAESHATADGESIRQREQT
jgi:hypothetical protein